MGVDIDRVIEKYIELRDHKEELEKRHKEELAPIKEQMQTLAAYLQRTMQEQGVNQMKGAHGTVFVQTKSAVKSSQWQDTLDWLIANERWELLEKRLNKTQALQLIDEEGVEIPGVEVTRWIEPQVRRK